MTRTRAARCRRCDRDDHQRQPRQAQRVRRRHGRCSCSTILDQLASMPEIRAIVWRGEGKSFSSGRDASSIGNQQIELSHHELMRRGHRGIQQLWDIDAPVIVACKGWVMGGSFQRALLCDIRIAAEGTRFRLPELTLRRHPRHRRGGGALRDVRRRPGERPRADRPGDAGRGGVRARHREPRRARSTSSTRPRARWPSRSRPRRR